MSPALGDTAREHMQQTRETTWGEIRRALVCHCCFEVVHELISFFLYVFLYLFKIVHRGGPTVNAGVPAISEGK